MRPTFINTITRAAETNENIFLIVADIGFGLVYPFAERFPDRFINVGVAEQNMIGVAAGLAMSGKMVFCYSIGNFPTLRCLEQIRNDVCYHRANVCIVAGSTGVTYGELGSSHHATEDIAIMRSLPNMTVVAPGSLAEVKLATEAISKGIGPCYLRLGRFTVPEEVECISFNLYSAYVLVPGEDLVIMATGNMLPVAVQASKVLASEGKYISVMSMHTIKPLDNYQVEYCVEHYRKGIITLEEHSVIGGLGGAVAEEMTRYNCPPRLIRMGLRNEFITGAYSQEEILKLNGLTVENIVRVVKDALK